MPKKGLKIFAALIACLFLMPSVIGQTQNSCVNCHKELSGAHYESWSVSVHGLNDITCNLCHGGDPTKTTKSESHAGIIPPSDEDSPVYFENVPKTCSKCHPKEYDEFTESQHYLNLRRNLLAPVCSTCHGNHYITSVEPLYISEKCSVCHNEQRDNLPEIPSQAEEALILIQQIETEIELAKATIAIAKEKGADVKEAEEALRDAESKLEKSGSNWHSFKIVTFKDDLLDALYLATSSYNLADSVASSSCISCHSAMSPEATEHKKYREWIKSSHAENGITCDRCHGGNPDSESTAHEGMSVPSTGSIPDLCGGCHNNPEYKESVHWEALKKTLETKSDMFPNGVFLDKIAAGEQDVTGPECTTCHGGHNIQSSQNPESSIYYLGVPEICGFICHKKEYFDFTESLHYKNLKDKKLAPECVTCHGNHEINILSQEETAEFCTICHMDGRPEVIEGRWHAFEKPAESLVVCGPTSIMLIALMPTILYGLRKRRKEEQ